MKKIKSIHLTGDGGILAVDKLGHIIPELSERNMVQFWAEFAISLGYELEMISVITSDKSFTINMIDGNKFEIKDI